MVSTCRIFWPSPDCAFLFLLFFFFVPIICLSVEVIGSISEGSDVRRPGCSKNSYFHMIRTGSYTRWHIHCCNLSISASLDWGPFVRVSIWRGIHLLTAFREWQYLLTLLSPVLFSFLITRCLEFTWTILCLTQTPMEPGRTSAGFRGPALLGVNGAAMGHFREQTIRPWALMVTASGTWVLTRKTQSLHLNLQADLRKIEEK